eukprot:10840692-Alexandrium_andersonii.AAC.1
MWACGLRLASSTRRPWRSPNCHRHGRTQRKPTPRHAFDSQVREPHPRFESPPSRRVEGPRFDSQSQHASTR